MYLGLAALLYWEYNWFLEASMFMNLMLKSCPTDEERSISGAGFN
jgi:hypothetical protein